MAVRVSFFLFYLPRDVFDFLRVELYIFSYAFYFPLVQFNTVYDVLYVLLMAPCRVMLLALKMVLDFPGVALYLSIMVVRFALMTLHLLDVMLYFALVQLHLFRVVVILDGRHDGTAG